MREPSVFLMDEPLSNLDAKLRIQMRSEVLRVHRRIGVATLYVTHDQTEAMTMGDRVAGAPLRNAPAMLGAQGLYDSPANIFVATFIGSPSMNLYRAGLDPAGESGTIVLGSQRLTLPAAVMRQNPRLARYQGRAVIAGIRPEHLVDQAILGTAPEPGASLTATVDLVEVLGSEQLVHFTIDAPGVRGEMEEQDQSLAGAAPGPGTGTGAGPGTEPEPGLGRARSSPRR